MVGLEPQEEGKKYMGKEKSLESLNEKAWYRLVKSVFLISFVGVLLIANAIGIMSIGIKNLNKEKTTIYCTSGDKKVLTLKQSGVYLYRSDFKNGFDYKKYVASGSKYTIEDILKACYGESNVKSHMYFLNTLDVQLFDIKPVYSYSEFINYFLIANLSIFGFFEVLRRIFYYVVLGKIVPKEKEDIV